MLRPLTAALLVTGLSVPCLCQRQRRRARCRRPRPRREPGIVLASEDLSIASDRISVAYLFRNQGQEPRTVRIAFPSAAADRRARTQLLGPSATAHPEAPNFVASPSPWMESRSPRAGRARLRGRARGDGPAPPAWPAANSACASMRTGRPETRIGEARMGRAGQGWPVSRRGGDNKPDDRGLWRSEAKFHWLQTFPWGRRSHRAQLCTGERLPLPRHEGGVPCGLSDDLLAWTRPGSRRSGACARGAADPGGYLHATVVPYIVTTARNWAAPIGASP